MPASFKTLRDAMVVKLDNQAKTGRNLVCEVFEVTFASDKTVELDVQMGTILFMTAFGVSDGSTPTALTWGSDMVKDTTTGDVTFHTSANSTEVWRVSVWGINS